MDATPSLRTLMKHETKKPTPLSEESLNTILKGLALLGRHYRRQLDELETQTYFQGLRDIEPRRLERAFTRALETLKRMPLIADLRELANERSTEALMAPPTGKYCERCQPDGYILEDAGPIPNAPEGHRYKKARRCPCQAVKG
jgi:hypothetical protein